MSCKKNACVFTYRVFFKNLEKVIMAEIDHLEKVIVSKIDHLSNKLDTCSQSKKR